MKQHWMPKIPFPSTEDNTRTHEMDSHSSLHMKYYQYRKIRGIRPHTTFVCGYIVYRTHAVNHASTMYIPVHSVSLDPWEMYSVRAACLLVLRIAYCVLRIAYCVLRIAYCILHIAYCILHTAQDVINCSPYISGTKCGVGVNTVTNHSFARLFALRGGGGKERRH